MCSPPDFCKVTNGLLPKRFADLLAFRARDLLEGFSYEFTKPMFSISLLVVYIIIVVVVETSYINMKCFQVNGK